MSETVRPIITLLKSAKVPRLVVEQLQAAGYCVLVVNRHTDVRTLDAVSGPADEILQAALLAIRASTWDDVRERFARNVARITLTRMGVVDPLTPQNKAGGS